MRHIGDMATGAVPPPQADHRQGARRRRRRRDEHGAAVRPRRRRRHARFSEIFARRGLTIDFGGSWALPRRVGLHRAKELTLLADIIDATEADRIGLVNRVVPDAALDAFVADWAARLAAGPPIALAQAKRLLNDAVGSTLEQALEDEGAAQTINFTTATPPKRCGLPRQAHPTFQGR